MDEQQEAWRAAHPLIPEDKYRRILELEAKELTVGGCSQGEEEEALEILGEYYPEEAE